MENEDRIKALNILFSACAISLLVSIILLYTLPIFIPGKEGVVAFVGPILAYCIGRYLCFKEYKD